jgi:hypothetical protein
MTGDSCRSLDPAVRFLAPPSNLFIKVTWCSFLRLTALPVHPGSYCYVWSRQPYFGTKTQVPHSVLTLINYKKKCCLKNSQIGQISKYIMWKLECWLEGKSLNPATLLWINSGPSEHDCLEILDEVFSRQPCLTNQPISHPDTEYFTDGNRFVQDNTGFAGYTDSKYVLSTINVHGALYKEEGSLTWEKKVLNVNKKF